MSQEIQPKFSNFPTLNFFKVLNHTENIETICLLFFNIFNIYFYIIFILFLLFIIDVFLPYLLCVLLKHSNFTLGSINCYLILSQIYCILYVLYSLSSRGPTCIRQRVPIPPPSGNFHHYSGIKDVLATRLQTRRSAYLYFKKMNFKQFNKFCLKIVAQSYVL